MTTTTRSPAIFLRIVRTVVPHLVVLAICATMIARAQVRYGSMPTDWADWSHVATKGHGRNSSLGGLVGQVANTAMPEGGPQAFECYTYER